ncbi:MAG TPA: tail fiber domain-containing protein [Bryobacteraceae bacterium]|nr:tail fiber domain-containing protein [Bryobacteraceae bacterium]
MAQAYSFEITVVPPGPLAYVTAYPSGQASPVAAIAVESPQGFLVSNTGIIPAGTNGSVDVYASNPTDIVIDINGYYALISSTGGNTAVGIGTLVSDTPNSIPGGGLQNTAVGSQALQSNTSGSNNTAVGSGTLQSNTSGTDNTAFGFAALQNNIGNSQNTAIGSQALESNTIGNTNTAVGAFALMDNSTGQSNTATGRAALEKNTAGFGNTAIGADALGSDTGGSWNTAIGFSTLLFNTIGHYNIAIGFEAGNKVMTSGNIHIGSLGSPEDISTIRIGGTQALGDTATQNRFFAAGIRGTTTGNNDAIPVVIDSNGQLGTVSSSRRFKEDIHDMDTASSDLMRLRPVTFRYQKPFADGSKPIQYGLIAEEVAEVYPDLVAHSADGEIESVKYQVLDAMLLNELKKEHLQVQQQAETIRLLQTRLAALEEALRPRQ